MKNRFFAGGDLAAGATVSLDDDERHHARVLRVRDGEEVEVFNGRGASFNAIYEAAGTLRLSTPAPAREPSIALHLAMAVIQLDKFELVLQKATELGVTTITPLVTARVEVRPERYQGKEERWRKIMFEAVKQSGRSHIPALERAMSFDDAIARPGLKVMFDADRASTAAPIEREAILLIGPEGGWTEEELKGAEASGCLFQQLGPRRLRAETAAIAAIAYVAARTGQL